MVDWHKIPKKVYLVSLALLCFVIAAAVGGVAFFQTLELKTVDFRFRLLGKQKSVSPDIVIVEIDDWSIKNLAELRNSEGKPVVGRWPWPRDVHATLLEYMHHAGAKMVVFDLLFTEKDVEHPQFDQALAEATGSSGNVVHAIFIGVQKTQDPAPDLLRKVSIPAPSQFKETELTGADFPLPSIAREARALGHVAIALDPDGPWRRSLLVASFKGRLIPSLSLAAVLVHQGLDVRAIKVRRGGLEAGSVRAPLDSDGRLPIWFNGGPGTYKSYGYNHIFYSQLQLENGEPPLLNPEVFRNKIVLVGITAAGLHDVFTTPYSGGKEGKSGGKMAGVEVHANSLDNLLHNRYLLKTPLAVNLFLRLGAALLPLGLLLFVRLTLAGILSLAAGLVYLGAAQFAFANHRQLPMVPALLSWGLAVVVGLAYQYWIEGAEKRKVKQIFSRYVSRDVYHQLLENPAAAELGGKRSTVTVLFSDLRGFTSMSENRQPEQIISQLNEYFSAMVEIVFQQRGTVDKFVGDMIMALFNAPLADSEHADHAVQCAVAMNQKLDELNRHWAQQGQPQLRCGIGINSGEMIVGNVGAESIRSYTVIGDNVNLGARLESLCKDYKAEIIISEFTRALLQQDYPMQELGDVLVKGKSKPVKIFRVLLTEPLAEPQTA